MFAKLLTIVRIPELRRKILLTVVLLAVYRLGSILRCRLWIMSRFSV